MRKMMMAIMASLCGLAQAGAQPATVQLQIVETSDVHGCFFPYDFITRKDKPGSLARVSSYVKRLRRQSPNVILLDNGDILQGQPICYYSNYIDTLHSNIAADVCNYLQYDAQTIGNHDVETGHACYDKWRKDARYDQLCANIIDTRTGKPYYKPYSVVERSGVRVAVLGMITPAIPNWLTEDLWSGLRFDDMVATARQWIPYIKANERPDVIVGLFHSGRDGGIKTDAYWEDEAMRVAREVADFDLILFGHDHTRFNGKATSPDGKEVVMLDPANNAMSVAQATVSLSQKDGQWAIDSIRGQLVDVTGEPVDSDYTRHFTPYTDKVKAFVGKQIGTLTHDIHSRDGFFGNSAFNDLILNLNLELTHADIALSAPLQFNSTLSKGPIYVADMFNLYKYENQLYVMRLTGEEIRKHLEMSYDLWVNTMKGPTDHLLLLSSSTKGDQQRLGFKNLTFNFDSAAGIDYLVDVTKPDGKKVRILRMSNGKPFDERKWYNVAVNSYRANGGGELLTRGAGIPADSLKGRITWRSEKDLRYYLMQAIEKKGTIDPQPNHNWRFVPDGWATPAAERDRQLLFGK